VAALKETFNLQAFQLLTNTTDSSNCLKQIVQNLSEVPCIGSYEGFTFDDEMKANKVVIEFRKSRFCRKPQFNFGNNYNRMMKLLAPLVDLLKEGKIWWNPIKPRLPDNDVPRKVSLFEENATANNSTTLLELSNFEGKSNWNEPDDNIENVLVLLVDSPGMGKSSALTKLEMDLRSELKERSRLIIRLNMNEFECAQDLIPATNSVSSVESIIRRLFKPLENTPTECASVYLLLDGLDEANSNNQEVILNFLKNLLSDRATNIKGNTLFIEKIVLTTRSHLKELIEAAFKVKAYSLVPFNEEEQILFLGGGKEKSWDVFLSQVPHSMRELLSNPLMLGLYSLIQGKADDNENALDLNEIHDKFIIKKYELCVFEKRRQSHATKRVLKKMLSNNIPFYYYVAVLEILGLDGLEKIEQLENNFLKCPTGDNLHDLLSFGIVVKVGDVLKFEHGSFAEYFFVMMMTDTTDTPPIVRNALFALGYEGQTNIAEFLSCVLRRRNSMNFVMPGWTEFIPEQAQLSRYKDDNGILFNHILENTIDCNCTKKTKLIVQDCFGDKLFLGWLENNESRIKWERTILKSDSMVRVTVAVVLALASKTESQELWKDLFWKEIISSEANLNRHLNFLLLEKLQKSRKEVAYSFRLVIDKDNDGFLSDKFFSCILSNPQLSNWIMEAFTKKELLSLLSDKETRVSDIVGLEIENVYRRWGREFCPGSILQFRHNFGKVKGRSLFTHKTLSEDSLMNIVWDKIQEAQGTLQYAVDVICDDKNFGFLKTLSKSLTHLERTIRGCDSQSGLSGSTSDLLEKRIKLVSEILGKMAHFWKTMEDLECETEDFKCLAEYTRIPGGTVIGQSKSVSDMSQLFKSFFGSSLSCFNEHHLKALNKLFNLPFELVLNLLANCEKAQNPHPNLLCKLADELNARYLLKFLVRTALNTSTIRDWPSVWEVLFLPEGLAYQEPIRTVLKKKLTPKEWKNLISKIMSAISNSHISCCSVGVALEEIRKLLDSKDGKGIMIEILESEQVIRQITNCVKQLWLENVEVAKCYLKGVVNMYMNKFKVQWNLRLMEKIPVQLLIVGEEIGWKEFVAQVERLAVKSYTNLNTLKDKFSLSEICKYDLHYNRCCDWYRFFIIFPKVKDKVPPDYRTYSETNLNWEVSLLRVWTL